VEDEVRAVMIGGWLTEAKAIFDESQNNSEFDPTAHPRLLQLARLIKIANAGMSSESHSKLAAKVFSDHAPLYLVKQGGAV
jgi:hypothetical protein